MHLILQCDKCAWEYCKFKYLEFHEFYLTLHAKLAMRLHVDDIRTLHILQGLNTWMLFIINILNINVLSMCVGWWNKVDTCDHEFLSLLCIVGCNLCVCPCTYSTFMNVLVLKQYNDSCIGTQLLGEYLWTMKHPYT